MPPDRSLPAGRLLLADGSCAGEWWHQADDGERIICDLCPRECHLKPGDRGFCFVRENREGSMVLSTYGRSTGFCIDPVEKKPLNHFHPGTSVLSFGTAGCNLGCKFCQNHDISKSRETAMLSEAAPPDAIARAARELDCRSVAFTYNDPVIWAEYAIDTARACRAAGIKTIAVTAGYISPAARQPFFAAMDAANVDLKGFTEDFYQRLTLSHLSPVLETLAWLKRESDVWFEITNLLIPRANDAVDELRQMCDWILNSLGDDTPVHFTAFHPDFKLTDRERTPAATLEMAHETARRQGLKYAYVGNINDPRRQSTWCPSCGELLIERNWHELGAWRLNVPTVGGAGTCGRCGFSIAGRFEARPGDWGRKRQPVRIAQFTKPPIHVASNISAAMNAPLAAPPSGNQPTEGISLIEAQRDQVHHAACQAIASAVGRRPLQLADETLAGAAVLPVWGVFVSAKRNGHLRGCCGSFGGRSRLIDGLRQAAARTAVADVRMPPLSASELEKLEIEVWLLHGPQRVTCRAPERAAAVEIGRHGLQISLGEKRGLLLPGVAIDRKYSSEEFLDQVCLKAELPISAWRDESSELATFEGLCLKKPFDSAAAQQATLNPAGVTAGDLAALAAHCRQNLARALAGDTPNIYLFDAFDGPVTGLMVTLRGIAGGELSFAKLSLRPGMPMQVTLAELVATAAKTLREQVPAHRRAAEMFGQWRLELTILDDAAVLGTVADCNLSDESPERAIVVVERGKSAWLHAPTSSPEELLAEGKRRMHIGDAERTPVYSFRCLSTMRSLAVVHAPRAQPGATTRRSAVAGAFYPAEADECAQTLDQLFEGLEGPKKPTRAIMVPHAGWRYSGRLAAQVFASTGFEGLSETVIVIGPKHTPHGVEWAVAPNEIWEFPGGAIASDVEFARELAQAIPGLELDSAAHRQEHAIEVELPLLARVRPGCRIVGVAMGAAGLRECQDFARGLAQVIERRERAPLLVISSDMNHFANDAETRRLDALALAAMESGDPENLFRTVRGKQISMCGVAPAVIVMQTLQELGARGSWERVGYATSADVTGDASRVVGYAGMRFA